MPSTQEGVADIAEIPIQPVPKGTPALPEAEVGAMLGRLGHGWQVVEGKKLRKTYRFADFASALAWVNQVGHLADDVDHHPDIELGWGRATVEIWTHTVGGLHPIDFAFAARCERLGEERPAEP
jgi:4a-hydroxytetrahydrobiopterin dehydratase